MQAISEQQDKINALVHDLNLLMEQYEEAVRTDKYFEVKGQLRDKMRLLQAQMAELRLQQKTSPEEIDRSFSDSY